MSKPTNFPDGDAGQDQANISLPHGCTMLFIIGAMKAGTTSLFEHLAAHPEICPCDQKEPRFFLHADPQSRQLNDYLDLFQSTIQHQWCFEATTGYAKAPMNAGVPQRIHQRFPAARFVYMVRNPVERIYSQYLHSVLHGREIRKFPEAVRIDSSYLQISRYFMQIEQYLAWFPAETLHVLTMEDFSTDPFTEVRRIFEFLGINASFQSENMGQVHHVTEQRTMLPPLLQRIEFKTRPVRGQLERIPLMKPTLRFLGKPLGWTYRNAPSKRDIRDSKTEAWLREQLIDDIEKLEKHLNRSFDAWKQPCDAGKDTSAASHSA